MKSFLSRFCFFVALLTFRWAIRLSGRPIRPRPLILLAPGEAPSERYRRLVGQGKWN